MPQLAGQSECLSVVVKRALRLAQIAGSERLANRIKIVRDGVGPAAGVRARLGAGLSAGRSLTLQRLLQAGKCRLRSRQVAGLERASELGVVLLHLLRDA